MSTALQPPGVGAGNGGESKGAAAAVRGRDCAARLRREGVAAVQGLASASGVAEEQHQQACSAQEARLLVEVEACSDACVQGNRAVDLELEVAAAAATPQLLLAALAGMQARCQHVLQAKEAVAGSIQQELVRRDEAYVELLRQQAEETDELVGAMAQDSAAQQLAHAQQLEDVEAAYLQERAELLAATKAELDALLENRSSMEQSFMRQYLDTCTSFENQLEELRKAGAVDYISLKQRLDSEVAKLEAYLDAMQPACVLNQDKLSYSYRVLLEQERENKAALLQQKRKVNRHWEVLAKLKKRYSDLDRRFVQANARLTDEYQHVTQAFNHLQSKYLHFKAADHQKFEQVRGLKEEELREMVDTVKASFAQLNEFVAAPAWQRTADQPVPTSAQADAAGDSSQEHDGASSPAIVEPVRELGGGQPGALILAYRPGPGARGAGEPSVLAREYWHRCASGLAGPSLLTTNWDLMERVVSKLLGVLQGRTGFASQVSILEQENQALKVQVHGTLAPGGAIAQPQGPLRAH